MYTNTAKCSNCGKPSCCEAIHHAYQRYREELAALLASPAPDRARIAFLTLLIGAVYRRSPAIRNSAS